MGSLGRGLQILEFASKNQSKGATYSQILAHTGFPPSSCFRLLKELTELNYLVFDEETRKYFLSMKVAALGSAVTTEHGLAKLLHPYLEKLRDESEKTCNLGIMNKNRGMFLDVLYAPGNTIKLLSRVGGSFPLHCTALGKVLLTYADAEVKSKILQSELVPLTPRSITNPDFLEKQLEQSLADGYAAEHEESTLGIHCYAAPIFDYRGENVAAVSMACPYFDFEKPGEPEKLIRLIKSHAAAMSNAMGYRD